MGAPDEGEVFLSLEDDAPIETESVSPAVANPPEAVQATASSEENADGDNLLEADLVDSTVLTDATGSYTVSWPILGMDCPDCASKATRAMRQIKQVSNPNVSVTSGEVKFDVDLEIGPLFEISSVRPSRRRGTSRTRRREGLSGRSAKRRTSSTA